MKKEKIAEKSKETDEAQKNFVSAVQRGLLEMDTRLKELQVKIGERDQVINEMSVLLKSQQDQITNTPQSIPIESQAERNKPITREDVFMILREGMSFIKQQSRTEDPAQQARIERALIMESRLVDAMWEKMAKSLGLDLHSLFKSASSEAGVA